MQNFEYVNHTRIIFGKGNYNKVGDYIKPFSNKILIHYGGDGERIKKLGIYDEIIESFKKIEIDFIELGGVVPNPKLSKVYEGINICKKNKINFILAIGGGSVIDSAKAISLGAAYDGDVWDFFTGKNVPKKSLNVGVILTIPGSGSEMSESSIITKEEGLLKCVCDTEYNFPVFSILNPEICYSIPKHLMAAGISDIFSHLMERYFTNTENTELSDKLIESTMKIVIEYGLKIINSDKDYNNFAQIMWASTIAHNGMIGAGRQADWACHRIEHEISGIYDLTHGAGMAIVFIAWMKYIKDEKQDYLAKFAINALGIDENISKEKSDSDIKENKEKIVNIGIEKLEEFYKKLGLSLSLKEFNITDEYFEVMAEKALGTNLTIGNFKKLYKKDIVNILKLALNGNLKS